MAKRPNLLEALQEGMQAPAAPAPAEPMRSTPPPRAASTIAPSREGRVHLGGYFTPEAKQSLRLIQAQRPGASFQDLFCEALNDFFAKHNVPQCAAKALK